MLLTAVGEAGVDAWPERHDGSVEALVSRDLLVHHGNLVAITRCLQLGRPLVDPLHHLEGEMEGVVKDKQRSDGK